MPFLLLRISRYVGYLLLLASLPLPWFRVPVGLREQSHGVYKVLFRQPGPTLVFKIALIGIFLLAILVARRRTRAGLRGWHLPIAIASSVSMLMVGILYPAFTIQRCAAVSAHAAWLQMENSSLIVSVGDTFTSQEFAYHPNQPFVEIKQVLPRGFEVAATSGATSLTGLHITRLSDIIDWLGFSDAFCQFVYWGWFFALFGPLILVISHLRLRGDKSGDPGEARKAYAIIPVLLGGIFVTCTVCLLPIVMASRELTGAEEDASNGRFTRSLHHIDVAERWVPVLAYHTEMLYQRGWLERNLGQNSPSTALLSAIHEEIEGFYERASIHYFDLATQANGGPVAQEAFRGALRLAIKDYNSGLIDRARGAFVRLAAIDPTSVKTSYALQLTDLRDKRKDDLECEVSKFETLYKCFQSREKESLFSMAHRRLADLEYDYHDVNRLGDEMRAAVKPKE